MKPYVRVLLFCAATAIAAHGQISDHAALSRVAGDAPRSVGYQKRIQFPIAGATAAYSLDSNIVEATAATHIFCVTSAGGQTLAVTVPVPPPVLPPGFEPPEPRRLR